MATRNVGYLERKLFCRPINWLGFTFEHHKQVRLKEAMENGETASPSSPKTPDANGKSVRKFFNRLSLKSREPKSYEIEPTKTFIVQAIGTVERTNPGEEGLEDSLKSLYDTAIETDDLLRVKISISSNCVAMRGLGGQLIEEQDDEVVVPFSRITYVVADKKHQLFAFNDQVSNKPRKVISYAFICSDAESSATIASTLSSAFEEKLGRRGSRKRQSSTATM